MQDPTYYLESLEASALSPEARLRLSKILDSLQKLSNNPDVIKGSQAQIPSEPSVEFNVQPPQSEVKDSDNTLLKARLAVEKAFANGN